MPTIHRLVLFSLAHVSVFSLTLLPTMTAHAFERAPLPSEAPMEACPQHGAGFFRVPGTSTCLRASGRVAGTAAVGGPSRSLATGHLAIDTRLPTDAGPARGFVRIDGWR